MKKISILGSTGSIGTQTLEIVRENDDLQVESLVANNNIKLLEEQVREFNPKLVCVYNENNAEIFKNNVSDLDVKVVSGMDGMIECAVIESADIVVTAIVGMIGIRPTVEAIKAKKDIALANKETLVTAGHIIMPLAKEMGINIYPVDSEHSAVFQSINGEDKREIKKVILTASGGPFRGRKTEELKNIRPEDALKHPNWSMGRKITIDSATMVNKGLEVIEAKWLFDVDYDKVEVVVHPQSIVHSMVEYVDGAVMAQLGMPDMKLPIQYALYYPHRRIMNNNKLDFYKTNNLTFEEPDMETFRGLKLAYQVGREGGSLPTVYNAANEKAVALFLDNKIGFLDIYNIIEDCVKNHKKIENPSIEQILKVEEETYKYIEDNF